LSWSKKIIKKTLVLAKKVQTKRFGLKQAPSLPSFTSAWGDMGLTIHHVSDKKNPWVGVFQKDRGKGGIELHIIFILGRKTGRV